LVPFIKLKLTSLYTLNPHISLLPLIDLYKQIDEGSYNANYEDDEFTPREIMIWKNEQLLFYWCVNDLEVNFSCLSKFNSVILNGHQVQRIDQDKYQIIKLGTKYLIKDVASSNSYLSHQYMIKTVDFINDGQHIKSLNLMTTINPLVDFNNYSDNLGYGKDICIWLVDKNTKEPVGMGLARYDRILSEGIIDLIVTNQSDQKQFIKNLICDALIKRLSKYTGFITFSVNELFDFKHIDGINPTSFFKITT
jgi:hypothetical protein